MTTSAREVAMKCAERLRNMLDQWGHPDYDYVAFRNGCAEIAAELEAATLPDTTNAAPEKQEPRGCPTPGACSALGPLQRKSAGIKRLRKKYIDNAIQDLGQIYGMLDQGLYGEASDYCRCAAEWYTQESSEIDAALAQGKEIGSVDSERDR